MDARNQSIITEIVLLGFSSYLPKNIALFLLFSVIYTASVIGNGLIICVVILTPQLHSTMYFLICNLSFLDLCYSSTAVPRLLTDIFSAQRIISLSDCAIQVYLSLLLGTAEGLLLAVMAYDRYAAICHALYYPILMSWRICFKLTVFVWMGSFMMSVVPSLATPTRFCSPNKVNHFMCDVQVVLTLACEDTHFSELTMLCVCFFSLLLPFGIIIVSYICIITSVLKIHSVERAKAFSTCTSHITVVILCYGSAMVMYFGPSSNYSSNQKKYVSVLHVIISPVLNPLIYSLKNRDVNEALRKLRHKIAVSNLICLL